MKKLYRPVLTVLMVIGAMGVSGCDRKEDAGVKTIASFKDLTPPPFSKVVSHKSDIAQEWVKKDAFGTPQYTVKIGRAHV